MQTNTDRTMKTTTSILQAATKLTKEKGWKNTTIREICAKAGVSVGAFYHHFASKQELMNNSFMLFDATLPAELPDCSGSPINMIKSILLKQTEFIVREAGPLITEYYQNILADENRSAADPNRMYYQSVLRCAREAERKALLKKDIGPEYVTELLIKFVRGCIIDWCLHDYKYDVVSQTDKELDILLNGLCTDKKA